MAIDFNTLFARLGKGFYIQETVNVARGNTIPPTVADLYDQFDSSSLAYRIITDGIAASHDAYKSGASSFLASIGATLGNVIVQAVADDVELDSPNLSSSLVELIRQMKVESESVDASTVSVSPSAITGNGDGVLVASAKRADGLVQQTALAETLTVRCDSDGSPATAGFTVLGESSTDDVLSSDWPMGSGIGVGVAAIDAENSLLINGSFDTEGMNDGTETNLPFGWILTVGTAGTTIRMSNYEVQQIAVTGPPTAGTYRINWTNPAGKAQSTVPLSYDASGAMVQAALRALEGLQGVIVDSSGTSPNFTHVITFTGVAGNVAQVSVSNATTGGTFTPSTTSAGDSLAFIGKSVILLSNGSELTTLNQRVTLEPLKQYAFNAWLAVNAAPSAGVITVDLVDGIGGSVINDEASVANSFTISAPGLTSTFAARNGIFRTPRVLPPIVYLRIRVSTAIDNTTQTAIDHAALVEMSELYPGGPSVSVFSGKSPFTKGNGAQVAADFFTLTVANDRASKFQDFFERNFGLAGLGLILPSVTDGSETQADSLIG